MTPKEKAKELVDKIYNLQSSIAWDTSNENKEKAAIFNDELGADVELYWHELAKQSAMLTVDEILNIDNIKPYILHKEIIEYWENVKQEINKL